MDKRNVRAIATLGVILFGGLFGLFVGYIASIPTLISYTPYLSGSALNVGSSDPANFTLLGGLGSCCICIPIPLIFSFFALFHQQTHASVVEDTISDQPLDI